jgi:hypothetical protein
MSKDLCEISSSTEHGFQQLYSFRRASIRCQVDLTSWLLEWCTPHDHLCLQGSGVDLQIPI